MESCDWVAGARHGDFERRKSTTRVNSRRNSSTNELSERAELSECAEVAGEVTSGPKRPMRSDAQPRGWAVKVG